MSSGGVSVALPNSDLLYFGFNQDNACFACGTETGFRIYNCDPFKERCRREFAGGIGYVEMLYRCNIIALVGGGKNPKFARSNVMIWDDQQEKCIGELIFRNEVKAVRLRRDRVVVVLEYKIYVYNFEKLSMLHQIETVANPKGICSLCQNPSQTILACLGFKKGHVRVELYNLKKTNHIAAHNGVLSCLSLNNDGTRLATASEKGTLIRIFDTFTGDCLRELRRGANRADILSLSFNSNSNWLSCTSDTGTIHIFSLETVRGSDAAKKTDGDGDGSAAQSQSEDSTPNKSASSSFMKSFLPGYFSSEASVAQFRVTDNRSICVFGSEPNTIIVITSKGELFQCSFDPVAGGPCHQISHNRFLGGTSESEQQQQQQQPSPAAASTPK